MNLLLLIPIAALAYLVGSVRILRQYERGVVFFLGKYTSTKGPGVAFVPLGLTHMKRVSLRIVAMDIPAQDVITRDNISVKVNAVLYFRVLEPSLAIIEIQDYLYATGQMAQTTLLSVLGQVELDELLADRRKVSSRSSTSAPTSGGSKSPRWRSRTCCCPTECAGPSPGRRKRSGSGGPR
jgi:regulator of protease activity HflC (stomatin/prohibitin superfamily)